MVHLVENIIQCNSWDNLKSNDEWNKYINGEFHHLAKKPDNIPSSAYFVYKDKGWIGVNDWLGNDGLSKTRVTDALSFEEAREFVRSLKLKNEYEWNDYKKGELTHLPELPINIPKVPCNAHKNDGWIIIRNWLGVE